MARNGFWEKKDATSDYAYHNAAYHSHFEGYVERRETDPVTGKNKIVRIYTAEYYVWQGTAEAWLRKKLRTVLLFAAALALFILAGTALEKTVFPKYFQLGAAVGLLCFYYCCYPLFSLLSAPRKMTVGQYKKINPRLSRTYRLLSIVIGLVAVLKFAGWLLLRGTGLGSILPSEAALLAACVVMCVLYMLEKAETYTVEDNEAIDEPGVRINE